MKKDILLIHIEGWMASMRDETDTISSVFDTFHKKYQDRIIDYQIFQSFGLSTLSDIKAFLKKWFMFSENLSIFVSGKSMGGAKLVWVLKRYWKLLSKYKKMNVLFIDAHGRPIQERFWQWRPYGKNRNIKIEDKWKGCSRLFSCVYQQKDTLEGAKVTNIGEENRVFINDDKIDHYNIIHRKETHDLIEKGMKFLL